MPTYNSVNYIKEALGSVFEQTYQDFEVVVLDDGSTDGTERVLIEYANSVRYYRTEHIGQYAARNKLIELAQGKFITFLDADDMLFPDALERLRGVVEMHGEDIFAYGCHVGIDETGKGIKTKHRKLPSGDITTDLFERIYVHSCGTLCHRRLFEDVGGFDVSLKRCAAYKLFLELSLRYRFFPAKGPVFKRRRHSGNLADRSFPGRKIELEVLEDFYFSRGKDVIPRRRAMKRLAEEGYRAGRCALMQELPEDAKILLKQALCRHVTAKCFLLWVTAAMR